MALGRSFSSFPANLGGWTNYPGKNAIVIGAFLLVVILRESVLSMPLWPNKVHDFVRSPRLSSLYMNVAGPTVSSV